jgi:hypothetical protein
MLKLLFNRNSLIVKACFWGAALLTAGFLYRGGWMGLTLIQKILFGLMTIQVIFAKAVEIFPWYPKDAPGPGISLQFQKAIVPVAYLWVFAAIFMWLRPMTFVLFLFNLLLLPMGIVACILIHFHRKDSDPSRPNFLSGSPERTMLQAPEEPDLQPEWASK